MEVSVTEFPVYQYIRALRLTALPTFPVKGRNAVIPMYMYTCTAKQEFLTYCVCRPCCVVYTAT